MSTIILGGGLAGLTAAVELARGGEAVVLLEARNRLGGRATTDEREGHLLNQGPHAVYLDGVGLTTLRSLGVDPPGGVPPTEGFGVIGGRYGRLPGNAWTLLRTDLIRGRDKLGLAMILAKLDKIDANSLASLSTAEWLRTTFRSEDVRALVAGLARVSTYCADLDRLSADLGVRQLQLAFKGVLYVDGGWDSIVSSLAELATAAGADIRLGRRATSIEADPAGPDHGWVVHTDDGTEHADQVIVAGTSPQAAATLTGSGDMARWAADQPVIAAASLDVGLRSLPSPDRRFAFGIDEPTYFSVHNPPADLGRGATLHVMEYLAVEDDQHRSEVRARLEGLLDLLQPGWQEVLTTVRFQRRLVVTNHLPTSEGGGLAGRFPVAVPDRTGLFVAGDWVGPEGHLADASIASGAEAAKAVLRSARRPPERIDPFDQPERIERSGTMQR